MTYSDHEHVTTDKPIQRVISKLTDFKKGMALCPAHEDTNRSLSVSEGDDGRVLLRCHAGCRTEDIVSALGLSMSDLFPASKEKERKEIGRRTHNYPGYRKTVISFSDGSKTAFFERFEKGSWHKGLNGHKQTLYNLDALEEPGIRFLSESEKDADRLNTLGFSALSFGGAENWRAEYADLLAGHEVVILPHHDEPGWKAAEKATQDLTERGCKVKVIPSETWGQHKGADVADWLDQFKDKDEAAERLSVLVESASDYQAADELKKEPTGLTIINASSWLETNPPEPNQIISSIFDTGDKLALIGASKLRKSFFLQQMLLSIAAGVDFLSWRLPTPKRVLYCQFEIRDHHQHRRLKKMAGAMGITPAHLEDRLQIINARGLGIVGPDGIEKIKQEALKLRSEVIAFDPLYKVAMGAENAAEDIKVILNAFDTLAEQTGAAIVYAHHDPKGSPGDRDIRDRGAGSNVLGRDYDACITLTAHAQDPDAAIIDVLLRNYPPQEPFTIMWTQREDGGFCYDVRYDILPDKRTSKTKEQAPHPSTFLPIAESILRSDEMEIPLFKADFKSRTSLSDHKIREFIGWATSGEYILERSLRGKGINKKWLRIGRKFSDGV